MKLFLAYLFYNLLFTSIWAMNLFYDKIIFYRSSHQSCSMKKGALVNFTKFTGKHLCQGLFFNKLAGMKAATLLKKKLRHRCFPANFAKFLRTAYLQKTSGRLLLTLFVASFLCFPLSKIFSSNKVVSCEKTRLVEKRL